MAQRNHDSLRAAVLQRLDLLDRAATADASTLLPLARVEINRLADGWRLLLIVHQQNAEGRCRACPAGLRARRWPCQVWRMAHEQLIGEGASRRRRSRPLRRRRAPVADVETTVPFPAIEG
jgi:hypothetical protein